MCKNNMKSIRISDEVLRIVESIGGKGFNQKFENLVIDYKKTLPDRKAMAKNLDEMIDIKRKKLKSLTESINKAETVKFNIDRFLQSLDY